MHLEAMIDRVWRFTGRPWLSEFGDALGGRDGMKSEMHLETEIKWTQWCTWRLRSSELSDALGGRGRASLDIHLEAKIEWTQMHCETLTERVWKYTCRLWSGEIGAVLGGVQFGGSRDGSWDSIHWLTCNCRNVESWVQHTPRDEKLAGTERLSIFGWCCSWWMLYLVLTHDYGMKR